MDDNNIDDIDNLDSIDNIDNNLFFKNNNNKKLCLQVYINLLCSYISDLCCCKRKYKGNSYYYCDVNDNSTINVNDNSTINE